ncbi:SulP family inorganic anion transporter [Streptomyces alfalfae]|uniref:SulP family inorganic anion transporter n=1 Tax=Streptomyces alfalfae TaxID=1642299 RepID=A0A4Q7ENL9_9ACTN|nr:SulP family inorganic anion transporter [Streptomyces alfalfae]AYA20035.1 SulP family inorganic anion transporter [Streptomyces fradiae]QQC87966.1 SulP family inorganic anion transporter [Streptomyces alfalfae]RXX44108.1 SulP family inorganic anion transporter [Streptomyces alfalfae]RZM85554.1 SulP family inorganic anion transporter [Streptomyces alfalfae]
MSSFFSPYHKLREPGVLRQDLLASLVVFLVALPLCVGVAVASGVPAELGLVTGIVGGLVVGFLPGSALQVSGPAAGLTVLVFEAVREFGLGMLGAIVLLTGALQVTLGLLRCGRWFRAISVSVVQGMLAGIGLVLILGQLYTMAGAEQPRSGIDKIAGLPRLIGDVITDTASLTAAAVGVGTIAVLVLWPKLPAAARVVPAPLAAVALATAAVAGLRLDVANVEVRGLVDAVQPPGLGDLADLGSVAVLGTVLAFTLIASAESLFSAAAVDRMHDGPRTHYDKELVAQGVGNTVCGVLGALPMTAVIVRSSANVRAGARTPLSRIAHGAWLLLFAVLLPSALGIIPLAALAGVLVHAGCKLIPVKEIVPLARAHRGEAVVLSATAIAIVVTNMFEGVVLGLVLAVVKSAWDTSHVQVDVRELTDGRMVVTLTGNATFLRLPRILETLEAMPKDRPIELDLTVVRHLDHACRTTLDNWALRHNDSGTEAVRMRTRPPSGPGSTAPGEVGEPAEIPAQASAHH